MLTRCIAIATVLLSSSAHADEPNLIKELQPLAWMIGDWKAESFDFNNANWLTEGTGRAVDFGREHVGATNAQNVSTMQVHVADNGKSIEIKYSYAFFFRMFPLHRGRHSVNEIIRWNTEKQMLEIVVEGGGPRFIRYLKQVTEREWQTMTEEKAELALPFERTEDQRIRRWVAFQNPMRDLRMYDCTPTFTGVSVKAAKSEQDKTP